MKLVNRILATCAVTVVSLALATGVWAQDAAKQLSSESVIETIKKRGTMRVGLDFFVPWAMRAKNGELVGFEVDVATKVAEDMGVKLELVPTAWDGIIPALLSGTFDVVIAGMSITPERHLRINFTNPYASSGMMIAASTESAPGLSKASDFNDRKYTVGGKRGTIGVDAAKKYAPKAKLRQYDEEAVALQDVTNGTISAYYTSSPVPERAVASSGGRLYLPVTVPFDGTLESFAVRKGDPDALSYFNSWILLNTHSGWLKERHDYWFVGDDWNDQVDVK